MEVGGTIADGARQFKGQKLGRMVRVRYTSGMDNSPFTTLIRVDPDRHMNRRYSVTVQATLLEQVAVVCIWGSRRSSYQRLRTLPAASVEEAQTTAERIVRAKEQRGYHSVT